MTTSGAAAPTSRGVERAPRLRRLVVAAVVLGVTSAGSLTVAAPASAGFVPKRPESTNQTQRDEVRPTPGGSSSTAPASTCRVYASPSGFGMLCSTAGVGMTLGAQATAAGIDLSMPFCWDDPDLPDGFDPSGQGPPPEGAGRWWLHTCLTFEGTIILDNARVSYEYRWRRAGEERRLNPAEEAFVTRVLGRGQIPYLQVQTSPISSPRVGQDVAFSMLCSSKVICTERADGRHIETPRIDVGGVVMHAELVHLEVLPEGPDRPSRVVDCRFGGLPRTAEELDRGDPNDPRVCRWSYDRSSDGAGGGARSDRFAAKVTAFWQVFVDDGTGPKPFRFAYEKSSTNLIRVTEVQTLVVS